MAFRKTTIIIGCAKDTLKILSSPGHSLLASAVKRGRKEGMAGSISVAHNTFGRKKSTVIHYYLEDSNHPQKEELLIQKDS